MNPYFVAWVHEHPFYTPPSPLPQGFNEGVMIIGPHSGRKVSEVKPIIKGEMVAAGQAIIYSEPEKQVGVAGYRGAQG